MLPIFEGVRWRPGVGDPYGIAWLIVAAYLINGGLCLWARRVDLRRPHELRFPTFWLFAVLAMLFLGVNKQLDLQTLFTEIVRGMARRDGWYDQRRTLQVAFIGACAGGGLAILVGGLWTFRRRWREYGAVLSGITVLGVYLLIRAASFHHLDTILYHWKGYGNRVSNGLELAGAVMIGLGVWRFIAIASREPAVDGSLEHREKSRCEHGASA